MKRSQFTHQWVTSLLEAMYGSLNRETMERLLESCGRACARGGAVDRATACAGNLESFVTELRGWVGPDNVSIDGRTVHVVYDRCFCTQQLELPEHLGETYCSCSRGWLKEMFETVLGRPVEVEIASTIREGSDRCRFTVHV